MENEKQEIEPGLITQNQIRPGNQVICKNGVSLEELFTTRLCIPKYQRCFCWRKRNVVDLLETLRLRASDKETHLGTIILKCENDGQDRKFSIVDGQQRLLTLTILAFCLGNKKSPLLEESLSGTSNDAKSAQKHLYWAKKTIETWLKPDSVKNALVRSILKIQFTAITLPNESSEDLAYTFFNAVNSSGKKLSDYDLLKAHHLRFIADEAVARAMAKRWDANGADGYAEILHKTLYRLRNWSRYANPAVDAQDGHILFNHFSARATTISGIFFPPLTVRFNSTIKGGALFFYYAEHYRMLWDEFKKTEACSSLYKHLNGHSRDVLRDIIRALLFSFYCRFGGAYLDDALFCVADAISILRNGGRVGRNTLRADFIKDCLFSLNTALEPGQFFDWCLSPEREYKPEKGSAGSTQDRYWKALGELYGEISGRPSIMLKQQIEQRKVIQPPDEGTKTKD